ncbi:MAG: hypothetical protein M1835_005922 [Candelina submexicana]|nr:MAG: hypothetical protein M1835_005922 [Candelina submexicana]
MAPPREDSLIQTILNTESVSRNPDHATGIRSPYFSKPSRKSTTPHISPKAKEDHETTSSSPPNDQQTLLSKIKSLKTDTSSHLSSPLSLSSRRRNKTLAQTASETKSLLPTILKLLPTAPATGILYKPSDLPTLSQTFCPHYTHNNNATTTSGTPIRILNRADALDTAISLSQSPPPTKDKTPVCILNMANATHGGGGWLKGALAQEEALCYRTSLSFTLKRKFYPLPELSGIYSPSVIVIRQNLAAGHALLDLNRPDDLPVVSVVSVAAIRDPPLTSDGKGYARRGDRELMKEKLRMVLRIAGVNGHRRLVLGALGCGAFRNPREEVVRCWREVFREGEFGGGWWESVVFAVLDGSGEGGNGGDVVHGDGNYGVFFRELEGLVV